jgi:hypothetical protein
LGGLTMLFFGLGTLPGILAAGVFSQRLSAFVQHQKLRQIAGVLLIFYGFWTVFIAW